MSNHKKKQIQTTTCNQLFFFPLIGCNCSNIGTTFEKWTCYFIFQIHKDPLISSDWTRSTRLAGLMYFFVCFLHESQLIFFFYYSFFFGFLKFIGRPTKTVLTQPCDAFALAYLVHNQLVGVHVVCVPALYMCLRTHTGFDKKSWEVSWRTMPSSPLLSSPLYPG